MVWWRTYGFLLASNSSSTLYRFWYAVTYWSQIPVRNLYSTPPGNPCPCCCPMDAPVESIRDPVVISERDLVRRKLQWWDYWAVEDFRRLIQYWIVKDGRTGGHFVISYCAPCIASPGKNSAARVLNVDSRDHIGLDLCHCCPELERQAEWRGEGAWTRNQGAVRNGERER